MRADKREPASDDRFQGLRNIDRLTRAQIEQHRVPAIGTAQEVAIVGGEGQSRGAQESPQERVARRTGKDEGLAVQKDGAGPDLENLETIFGVVAREEAPVGGEHALHARLETVDLLRADLARRLDIPDLYAKGVRQHRERPRVGRKTHARRLLNRRSEQSAKRAGSENGDPGVILGENEATIRTECQGLDAGQERLGEILLPDQARHFFVGCGCVGDHRGLPGIERSRVRREAIDTGGGDRRHGPQGRPQAFRISARGAHEIGEEVSGLPTRLRDPIEEVGETLRLVARSHHRIHGEAIRGLLHVFTLSGLI